MSLLLFPILPARTVFLEETADMSWMIRDPENLLQKDGDPLGRPAVVLKTKGGCPTSDEGRNLSELFVRQCCLPTGSRMAAQSLDTAAIVEAFEPLANCPLRDP